MEVGCLRACVGAARRRGEEGRAKEGDDDGDLVLESLIDPRNLRARANAPIHSALPFCTSVPETGRFQAFFTVHKCVIIGAVFVS